MEELNDLLNLKESECGFNNRVRELREREGLKQTEFAEKVHLQPEMICLIETNKKRLTLRNAIVISQVFNVSLDWLYGLNDNTGDYASQIIEDLRKVFKLDLENKTLSIDLDLAEYLKKLNNAYNVKANNDIPEDSFKAWLNGIKSEYNNVVIENKNKSNTRIVYKIQDMEEE